MFVVIDIILVAVFAFFTIRGYFKGFIESALKFLSGIIAFLVAYFVTPLLAPIVNDNIFYNKIYDFMYSGVNNIIGSEGVGALFASGDKNTEFRAFLERFGADYDKICENAAAENEAAVERIAENMAKPVSYGFSYVITFIVIFVLSLVLLFFVRKLLNLASKLPAINSANKVLGVVAGALFGLLWVWILTLLIKLCLPYLNVWIPDVFPEDLFERSFVLRIMYNINILRGLINWQNIKEFLKIA